jgi:hypothetical protein
MTTLSFYRRMIDSECRVLGMVSRNDLMVAIAPEAV